MPDILVFASGDKTSGGSGFRELFENTQTGVLDARIVGVVSQYASGGVYRHATDLSIPFVHLAKGRHAEAVDYIEAVKVFMPDLVCLSGWSLLVKGLDPKKTINIHPGPLPRFGGKGFLGHKVHEAVMEAFRQRVVRFSAVTMHFVTVEYDEGPTFFRYPVLIREDDTPDTLGARVNEIEHGWQSYVTNLVAHGGISWDGKNPETLKVPENWPIL